MAITNPLAAAVSNLMFWVPKNDVRNEKLMKEVGLSQETSSMDHCCGFERLCVPKISCTRHLMLCGGPAACRAV